jgi:nucleoside phosphorylase
MKTVILVFAMKEEMQAFLELAPLPLNVIEQAVETTVGAYRVVCITTGVTMLNTYKLYPYLLLEKPVEVIQVGTCAGLKKQPIGSVLHAKTFFNADLDLTAFDRPLGWLWQETLSHLAKPILVSGSQFLASQDAVNAVIKKFDADAFDMESFGFFTICKDQHIPFSTIRGVSDNGETHANTTFAQHLQLASKNAAKATIAYLQKP